MKEIRELDGRARTRLETWGEIASHLGVEIRTAQRWERRMVLPVHRLDGSQAVFAFVDEIDGWRTSREKARVPDSDFVAKAVPTSLRTWVDDFKVAYWSGTSLAVAAGLILLAIVAFAAKRPDASIPLEPTSLALQGNQLVAFTGSGSAAWSYDFGEPTSLIDAGFRQDLRPWWQRMDADGDGTDEIVAVVGHPRGESRPRDVLYCFSLSGTLRYSYMPDLSLTFRQQRFDAPWLFFDIEPVQVDHSLWVTLGNSPWWPAAVLSLDFQGRATLRYVQPGTVRALKAMTESGKTYVLASGLSNEYASASLALLDIARPPATAPQLPDGPFGCLDCPSGKPEKYLLVPPSLLNRVDGAPYNRINDLVVGREIVATSYETETISIVYRITRDLRILSATPSDTYWSWASPKTPAPNWRRTDPLAAEVRTWTAGRWSRQRIPYTLPSHQLGTLNGK